MAAELTATSFITASHGYGQHHQVAVFALATDEHTGTGPFPRRRGSQRLCRAREAVAAPAAPPPRLLRQRIGHREAGHVDDRVRRVERGRAVDVAVLLHRMVLRHLCEHVGCVRLVGDPVKSTAQHKNASTIAILKAPLPAECSRHTSSAAAARTCRASFPPGSGLECAESKATWPPLLHASPPRTQPSLDSEKVEHHTSHSFIHSITRYINR